MGKSLVIFVAFVGLLFLSASMFVVKEYEVAVMFKFGKITDSNFEPGLHFKMPFINQVKKFDARIQTLDADPEYFLTSEKAKKTKKGEDGGSEKEGDDLGGGNLMVDSFVMWKIKDLKVFYTSVAGNFNTAESRLDQIVKDKMRGEFSKRGINQIISTDREVIVRTLKETLSSEVTALLGIEIVDIRLKRVDFPEAINRTVFSRMQAELKRIAADLRAKGSEEAEKVRANAEGERTRILAEAFRDSEILRGEGDATAAKTFADAFGENKEFYALYRSLNAYKKAFSNKNDMIVPAKY